MSKGHDWIGRYLYHKYSKHGRHHHHFYEPWYDVHSDYNTNAKSYYDYLARFNGYIRVITDLINRLMNRNIETKDTDSIKFNKKGDWIDNGECEPNNYDDIIELSANVKISKETESRTLKNTSKKKFTVPNGSKVKNDGVWSPDYISLINALDDEIGNINNKYEELEKGLQKIVDNLYKSGAITNNNINNFEFKPNRDIATGNINLFGGTSDGNSFIKTSDKKTQNDITAGY